jgi:hypothetical protein
MLNAVFIILYLALILHKNFSLFLYFYRYICRVDVATRGIVLSDVIDRFQLTNRV